jgi:hypothetical protein
MGELKCFVISPFGEKKTPIREWSDKIYKEIIKPVATEMNYNAGRTLDDRSPGSITQEIATKIVDADLVIADLTGLNPNVIYELALRHSTGKPAIQLSNDPSNLPFDIKDLDTIQIGTDEAIINQAKEGLRTHITAIRDGRVDFSTHFSRYLCSQCSQKSLSAKAYIWEIEYSPTLASEWLKQKPKAFKDAVKIFKDEGKTPNNQAHRPLLAEYKAYEDACGQMATGDLYYSYITRDRSQIAGYGILKFKGDNQYIPIEITGEENKNGTLLIKFNQPKRRVLIPPDIDEYVPAFNYTMLFNPDPDSEDKFTGQLMHPTTKSRLKVADTKLVLKRSDT